MILFGPQRGDDADDRIGRADAQLAADGGDVGHRGEAVGVDAVGNDEHLAGGKALVVDQEAAVRRRRRR